MSEVIPPPEEQPTGDPCINGLIEGFLNDYSSGIRDGEKAVFKTAANQGRQIEIAYTGWQSTKQPELVDLSKRLVALRLVRFLSKVVFLGDAHRTQKIDLGTGNEEWWDIDQYVEHYIRVEAHNQHGEYYEFQKPKEAEHGYSDYSIIASFNGFDIYKRAIMAEGWRQVHSEYLAAHASRRATILPPTEN